MPGNNPNSSRKTLNNLIIPSIKLLRVCGSATMKKAMKKAQHILTTMQPIRFTSALFVICQCLVQNRCFKFEFVVIIWM